MATSDARSQNCIAACLCRSRVCRSRVVLPRAAPARDWLREQRCSQCSFSHALRVVRCVHRCGDVTRGLIRCNEQICRRERPKIAKAPEAGLATCKTLANKIKTCKLTWGVLRGVKGVVDAVGSPLTSLPSARSALQATVFASSEAQQRLDAASRRATTHTHR